MVHTDISVGLKIYGVRDELPFIWIAKPWRWRQQTSPKYR